ncbi:MAG TPA: response regulator transcription factor [Desulfobulbus sp.]|nr:response regulator transcription factor [Desulfobulbus sp.]
MIFNQKKILLIEDDLHMRLGLQDNLEYEGYVVFCAESGEEGLLLFDKEHPDLILLDIMLPGMDGIEVCKKLRNQQRHVPIIMLSVRNSEVDKVLGLETGADDYLAKPFGIKELLARIHAALRRSGQDKHVTTYQLGDAEIDLLHHEVKRKGSLIPFTAKEFELLKFFIHNKGVPLSRDQLLEKVWGMEYSITTRTVDNHVLRLRKKLEESPDAPRFFITVYGVGYKFTG